MDSFLEYLVAKKYTGKDIAIKAVIVFLAVLLSLIAFTIFASISFLRPFSFFAVLCIGYLAYIISARMFIEYEYIFTNGILDIDIIRARRVRKRLASIKCSKISIMEKVNDVVPAEKKNKRTVVAVYNIHSGDIYKIEAQNEKQENLVIYFQPPERLAAEMKKFNPLNIIID